LSQNPHPIPITRLRPNDPRQRLEWILERHDGSEQECDWCLLVREVLRLRTVAPLLAPTPNRQPL
jgi:hypothetical protein